MMDVQSNYGDRFAAVYDKMIAPLDWHGPEISWLLAELDGTRANENAVSVVELGVGTGRVLRPLADRLNARGDVEAALTGIDSSAAMLERLEEADERAAVRRVLTDFSSPEGMSVVEDESADLVLCVGSTFPQLLDRATQRAAFDEMLRIVRPGGKIVLECQQPDGVRGMVQASGGKMFIPYPAEKTGLVWFTSIDDDIWTIDEVWIDAGVPHTLREQALLTGPEMLAEWAADGGAQVTGTTAGLGSDRPLTVHDTMYTVIIQKPVAAATVA